jgi:hypothetical protein
MFTNTQVQAVKVETVAKLEKHYINKSNAKAWTLHKHKHCISNFPPHSQRKKWEKFKTTQRQYIYYKYNNLSPPRVDPILPYILYIAYKYNDRTHHHLEGEMGVNEHLCVVVNRIDSFMKYTLKIEKRKLKRWLIMMTGTQPQRRLLLQITVWPSPASWGSSSRRGGGWSDPRGRGWSCLREGLGWSGPRGGGGLSCLERRWLIQPERCGWSGLRGISWSGLRGADWSSPRDTGWSDRRGAGWSGLRGISWSGLRSAG